MTSISSLPSCVLTCAFSPKPHLPKSLLYISFYCLHIQSTFQLWSLRLDFGGHNHWVSGMSSTIDKLSSPFWEKHWVWFVLGHLPTTWYGEGMHPYLMVGHIKIITQDVLTLQRKMKWCYQKKKENKRKKKKQYQQQQGNMHSNVDCHLRVLGCILCSWSPSSMMQGSVRDGLVPFPHFPKAVF